MNNGGAKRSEDFLPAQKKAYKAWKESPYRQVCIRCTGTHPCPAVLAPLLLVLPLGDWDL